MGNEGRLETPAAGKRKVCGARPGAETAASVGTGGTQEVTVLKPCPPLDFPKQTSWL